MYKDFSLQHPAGCNEQEIETLKELGVMLVGSRIAGDIMDKHASEVNSMPSTGFITVSAHVEKDRQPEVKFKAQAQLIANKYGENVSLSCEGEKIVVTPTN